MDIAKIDILNPLDNPGESFIYEPSIIELNSDLEWRMFKKWTHLRISSMFAIHLKKTSMWMSQIPTFKDYKELVEKDWIKIEGEQIFRGIKY